MQGKTRKKEECAYPAEGASEIRLAETDSVFKKVKSLSGRQLGVALSIRFDRPGLFSGKSGRFGENH